MASGLDATYAENVLDHSSGHAAMPAFTGTLQLYLLSAVGSATTNGTQSVWTGYTAGGNTITANAAATPGTNTWPVAASSWTNTSGATQTIAGVEHWDTAPKRYWWGGFASSISLPTADTLQFAAAGSSNNFP